MQTSLLVLSVARSVFSLCSFTIVIGTPVGIASAGISLVFLISNGIVKIFLKTIRRKKQQNDYFTGQKK